MEEDDVELIDYLRVIWKRKILIIVGALVCIVAGSVVSLRLPEIYRAEAFIKIGKILVPSSSSSSSSSSSFGLIDTHKNLQITIPVVYSFNEKEASVYSLKVESFSETSILKIIVKGPNGRRAEELLKGVVDRIIDSHLRVMESSIQPYRILKRDKETDIKIAQKDIAGLEVMLKDMITEKVDIDIIMMTQNNLWQMRNNLKFFLQKHREYGSVTDRLENDNTKMVGGTKVSKLVVKRRKIYVNIMLAGVVGLAMSFFLAFFIEYLENVRKREKKNSA